MPGVRIQHPTERNCTFTLVEPTVPYRGEPIDCSVCHTVHTFKTWHIKLDESGAGIVSPEVIERLWRIPLNPFQIANEVEKPPEQKLFLPTLRVPVTVKEQ